MTQLFSSPHGKFNYSHQDREATIERIVGKLAEKTGTFDSIAVSGASMMLIASVVAYRLKKNIILVRKEEEERNSKCSVEGQTDQRYIIIDDLIASGRTLKYVIKQIDTYLSRCTLVAVGTYFLSLKCTIAAAKEKMVGGYGEGWIEMFTDGDVEYCDLTP